MSMAAIAVDEDKPIKVALMRVQVFATSDDGNLALVKIEGINIGKLWTSAANLIGEPR